MQQKNIIHSYYKKEEKGSLVLLQVNPETFQGFQLTISDTVKTKKKLQYDEGIYDALAVDGFVVSGALEFNLHLKGLVEKQD